MNVHEPFGLKNRRKTQINSLEARLKFSKIKNLRRKSISSRKVNILNDNNNQNNPMNVNINILDRKNKKNIIDNSLKTKPLLSKKTTYYKSGNNKLNNYNDNIYEKNSYDILDAKTQRMFNRYTLKNNNVFDKTSFSDLNIIERNIKSIINKMKNEIERNNRKSEISNSISPKLVRNRLFSSPSLKLYFTKKKVNNRKSKSMQGLLIIEEYPTNELNNSFYKKSKIKRSKSFNYSEKAKKKIFKKFKNKISNIFTNNFTSLHRSNTLDNDSDSNENFNGFAILPTSNFIFTFDLLLIIANLYTFIFFH